MLLRVGVKAFDPHNFRKFGSDFLVEAYMIVIAFLGASHGKPTCYDTFQDMGTLLIANRVFTLQALEDRMPFCCPWRRWFRAAKHLRRPPFVDVPKVGDVSDWEKRWNIGLLFLVENVCFGLQSRKFASNVVFVLSGMADHIAGRDEMKIKHRYRCIINHYHNYIIIYRYFLTFFF